MTNYTDELEEQLLEAEARWDAVVRENRGGGLLRALANSYLDSLRLYAKFCKMGGATQIEGETFIKIVHEERAWRDVLKMRYQMYCYAKVVRLLT